MTNVINAGVPFMVPAIGNCVLIDPDLVVVGKIIIGDDGVYKAF